MLNVYVVWNFVGLNIWKALQLYLSYCCSLNTKVVVANVRAVYVYTLKCLSHHNTNHGKVHSSLIYVKKYTYVTTDVQKNSS